MWIPDPRFEEPNLLVPGKRTNNPVRVDWTHPLTRDLEFFFVATPHGLFEVVNNFQCRLSVGGELSIITDSRGNLAVENSTGGEVQVTAPTNYDISDRRWTISTYASDTDGSMVSFGLADANGNRAGNVRFRRNINGVAQYYYRFVTRIQGTDDAVKSYNQPYFFNWTLSAEDGDIEGYVEDRVAATSTDTPDAAFDSNNGNFLISDDTQFSHWALWKRKLRVQEIREVNLNPYQFLIPA